MKSRNRMPLFAYTALLVLSSGFLATQGLAYDSWDNQSSAVDNGCIECHGGFRDSGYVSLSDGQPWNENLHDGHRNAMLDRDCDACHAASGRSPTFLNLSVGGVGLDPIGCVGCHGRAEDRGTSADCVDPGNPNPPCGDGAGLRQHHFNAGVSDCASCHLDADPINYTAVGEDIPPSYYFTPDAAHPTKPTDSCNPAGEEDFFASALGLDNDGDLVYDGLDLDCAAPPEIDVTPLALDFGAVAVGNSATLTATIDNLGGQDLTVAALTLTGSTDFALNPGSPSPPFSVPGGSTVDVLVDYTPSGTGSDSGALEIASDDGDEPVVSVSLAGSGVPPAGECQIDVIPLALDFGSVEVGEIATLSTAVGNNGTTDCVVSSLTLTGADFSLGAGAPAVPFTVSLGEQIDVPVEYTPASTGDDSGTLDVVSDDTNNPAVTVVLSGTGIAPRDIDVNPLALDFGSVEIPSTATRTVSLQNLGGADLTVTGLTLIGSTEFEFDPTAPFPPFVLVPGGSVDVSIDYTPADESSDSGTLEVASDDPDEPLVNVSLGGTGVAPTSQCDIDVNPLSLDLGEVEVGTQVIGWVYLQNTGPEDCVVSGLTLTGDPEFSFNPATLPPPFTVRPGGFTRGIPIDYVPLDTGTHSTTLTVTSNDPDETVVSVPISATGVPPTLEPDVELNPLVLDFGSVEIDTTSIRTLVIGNVGNADLTVTALTLTGSADFALGATAPTPPFSIAAGGSMTVPVEYTTADTGADSGLLEVTSDDPDEPVVSASLSGTGIPPLADQDIDVSPLSLDFGSVDQGTSATLSTAIQNLGGRDLTVTALTLTGSADFSLNASVPHLPFTVPAGSAVDVQLDYRPADSGADSGALAIDSDDPDEPTVSVSLAGTGIAAPDIGVSPPALDFGSVEILSTATLTVALQNLGDADLTVTGLTLAGSTEFAFGPGTPLTPFVLIPGGSVDVFIDYTPADENSDSGTLEVASDDPDEPLVSVSLNGTGALPTECDIDVNPLSLDLGEVEVGTQVIGWVYLQNTGTEDCVVSDLTLTGDPEFSFNPATLPPPFTVRPGGFTRGIPIDYAPLDAGPHSTTLAVTSNDPDETTVSVPISGTGGTSTLEPDVELNPLVLDFGSVEIDTTSIRTLVIGNVGNADLTVTALTLTGSADFALGATAPTPPFSIAAGGSMTVPVEYTTADTGADSGLLEVTSDDPDEPVVSASLSGTGQATPPDIDVSPLSLAFGTVPVGTTVTLATTIQNLGDLDLAVTGLSITGSADFALGAGAPSVPFTVPGGGSVNVSVDYAPSGVGPDSGTLEIASDDPDEPLIGVALDGTGEAATADPDIEVSPPSLDFGSIDVGTTATLTLTILNLGGSDLTVTQLKRQGSGDFALGSSAPAVPFAVPSGGAVDVPVDYTPSGVGSGSASLRIKSDDPDEQSVTVGLSGSGQTAAGEPDIDVSPLTLDFGTVGVGSTASRTTTIQNVGGQDLVVTGLSLTGSADFALGAGAPQLPFSVASGGSVNVPVDYAPSAEGPDSGTLEIASDDPDEPLTAVVLTGSGSAGAAVDLDIDRLSVTSSVRLSREEFVSVELRVRNGGSVDEPRPATVVGEQNGTVVYTETLQVSAPPGGGSVRFDFPGYTPSEAGDITWTATIADDDPDDDTAIETTRVRN